MTWDDYSHECQQCWDNYNAVPRREPCWSHRGKEHVHRELDDTMKGSTYVWRADDAPHDFSAEPSLLNRLHFLRWLWRYRKTEEEH